MQSSPLTARQRAKQLLKSKENLISNFVIEDTIKSKDVCGSEHLPEVEIFSLLEEQIPRYKLRSDALTEFAGYENQDWFIPSPALPPSDAHEKLSPDQIRETLNYFGESFFLITKQ
ncbi:trafficking kinesin-binding protein 1-like [Ctenocephalides felis]|uniref:trafficking kinesin-binding protein 1-like n=1 Tax=Ctenocephalides felis TaxID=7515 RepID=UPI000E6E29DD|nr:trafficking kinesin-binding protein 1-like [Ctenocephalides felis]